MLKAINAYLDAVETDCASDYACKFEFSSRDKILSKSSLSLTSMHRQNTPPLRAEAPPRNRRDSSTLNASSLKSGSFSSQLKKSEKLKKARNPQPLQFSILQPKNGSFSKYQGSSPCLSCILSASLAFPPSPRTDNCVPGDDGLKEIVLFGRFSEFLFCHEVVLSHDFPVQLSSASSPTSACTRRSRSFSALTFPFHTDLFQLDGAIVISYVSESRQQGLYTG